MAYLTLVNSKQFMLAIESILGAYRRQQRRFVSLLIVKGVPCVGGGILLGSQEGCVELEGR